MSIHYRDGVAILQLVVFIPCLCVALYHAARQGFTLTAGWIFFILFTIIRIVGSCTLLVAISNHATGLQTATAICSSVGLSPLLLGNIRVVANGNDILRRYRIKIVKPFVFRCVGLLTLGAIVLCVIGINTSSKSGNINKVSILTKVGYILFLVAWAALALLFYLIGKHLRRPQYGTQWLAIGLSLSLPFLLVRIVYSVVFGITGNIRFSPTSGNVTILLLMNVLEEFAVVVACLAVGFTFRGQLTSKDTEHAESNDVVSQA